MEARKRENCLWLRTATCDVLGTARGRSPSCTPSRRPDLGLGRRAAVRSAPAGHGQRRCRCRPGCSGPRCRKLRLEWAGDMAATPRHPLIPARTTDPQQDFPALELEILERWRERDVFAESLRRREGAQRWVFYEGPPTANGPPGSHHVLSRVFKDIYPRFQDDARLSSGAQGRLGLPRPAGGDRCRTGARASATRRRSRSTGSRGSTRSVASRCSRSCRSGTG